MQRRCPIVDLVAGEGQLVGLPRKPALHRRDAAWAQTHERVVGLGFELGAVEVQPWLVDVRPPRRRAEGGAVAALVTEVGEHRDLRRLIDPEPRPWLGDERPPVDPELGQRRGEGAAEVGHEREVRTDAHTQAADLVAVQAARRLLRRGFGRERACDLLEVLAVVHRQVRRVLPQLAAPAPDDQRVQRRGLQRLCLLFEAFDLLPDRPGDALSVSDGLDRRRRALERGVAAGEHARQRRLHGRWIGLHRAAADQLRRRRLQEVEDRRLAHRQHQGVQLEGLLLPLDRSGTPPAVRASRAELHALADHPAQLAVLDDQRLGRDELLHRDAFFQQTRHLLGIRGHLVDGSTVDHLDLAVAETKRGARRVHGHVASASDADALAELDGLTVPHAPQELDRVDHTVGVFAFEAESFADLCAGADHHVVEGVAQLGDGEVGAGLLAVADLDPEALEHRQILIERGLRQAVAGDGARDHAAGLVELLEDRAAVPGARELGGHCRATRACADDPDRRFATRLAIWCQRGQLLRHDESLHVPDRQRIVVVGPDAGVLALAIADPPEDRRQRIVLPGDRDRVGVAAFAHRAHVGGHVLVDRALVGARRFDAVEGPQRPRGLALERVDAPLGQHHVVAGRLGVGCEVAGGGATQIARILRRVAALLGLHHEVVEAGGTNLVHRGEGVVDVLEQTQVAAGLQQIRAHRDRPHPARQERCDVERVRPAGERHRQASFELGLELGCEVHRQRVKRPA